MARKKGNKKTTPVVFGTSVEEKAEFKKAAAERHMSLSEYMRQSARRGMDENRNDPAIMLNLIALTREIEKLDGRVPAEHTANMKKNIANVMILKGGSDYANF